MCDGCCLNRETKSEVEQSGFSKVEIVDFIVSSENWIFNMINPVPYAIYGWATKWFWNKILKSSINTEFVTDLDNLMG